MKRRLLFTFICITGTVHTHDPMQHPNEVEALLDQHAMREPTLHNNTTNDNATVAVPIEILPESFTHHREHLSREAQCRWIAGAFSTFIATTYFIGFIVQKTLTI